jgi:uncharacterized protein (DUF2249 family)
MEYLIEDKHPIPSKKHGPPLSVETATFRKMSHGQSFLIKCEKRPMKIIYKLSAEARKKGCKAVFRKEQYGWRVWKMEMKNEK